MQNIDFSRNHDFLRIIFITKIFEEIQIFKINQCGRAGHLKIQKPVRYPTIAQVFARP